MQRRADTYARAHAPPYAHAHSRCDLETQIHRIYSHCHRAAHRNNRTLTRTDASARNEIAAEQFCFGRRNHGLDNGAVGRVL